VLHNFNNLRKKMYGPHSTEIYLSTVGLAMLKKTVNRSN
jgi:hypothetical protein